MAQDTLTHGRKTIAGIDLTFGATTTAPCGKRRPVERTSADPARVDCPDCRAWAASEERDLARTAVAAAQLARQHPGLSPYTARDFADLANSHDARAERWDEKP